MKIWSARHMRVKYALSARESCSGIRASFRNDARASNARGYAWFSGGHFLGFHAISPVFMQIWKVFRKFGQNYTIKVGARLGRTIFSALGGLLKIDSGRDPNLIIHWKKSPRTPGGQSGTSKTPLNTLNGLAPLIWCILDCLDAFSDSHSCPKTTFLTPNETKMFVW